MSKIRRFVLILALVSVGCNLPLAFPLTPTPSGSTPTVGIPTPLPTATVPVPTPSLAPTSTPAGCTAPPIPLQAGLTRLAEGCLHITLNPGQTWEQDGYDLAAAVGYTEQLPCAAFFLALSWNVTSGPGDAVQWTAIRQGVTESLGGGATGSIAFGCAYYQVHNGSADPVTLDLRVVVDTP